MIPSSSFLLTALAFVFLAGAVARADDDVTVVPTPASIPAPAKQTAAADGSPVVHKSLHKKKRSATAVAGSAPATYSTVATNPPPAPPPAGPQPSVVVGPAANPTPSLPVVVAVVAAHPQLPAPAPGPTPPKVSPPVTISAASIPVPTGTAPAIHSPALVLAVETGLPVAKYSGMNAPIKGVSTYVPTYVPPSPAPLPAKSITGTTTHQPYYASILPPAVIPLTSTAASTFSPASRTTTPPPDFVFTDFRKKPKAAYPWKSGIITTMFWIGEGGSSISPTDNIGSAWDEHWRSTNRGNDSPEARNGFASADHASTVNPFYVALPYNDLAFPEKAHYVPRSWHRPNVDGKQVSACKDRWVEVKSASGHICFAQWEDVGPLRSDHAEYVFGDERPDTYTRAGLDVSPAVAQYLGIDGNRRAFTSWRFVDDDDVPPGQWLKYDEQAVIFTAMHQFRNSNASDLPIQKASEPIDEQNTESNKKRIDQSKG